MYQVVIVDDESFVLEDLQKSIDWEGSNFEITYTDTNPLNTLAYLRSHTVDLLITDISMPEMSGLELILEAKAIQPLLSVLVLSAYDNFDYVRSALRNGAENYLLKPLNPEELLESVQSVAKHLQERNTISNTYGSTMLTFRSLFTENWVRGTLDSTDFLTRAELLGINLSLDNYTVLIFSSTDANAQKMSTLFDWLLASCIGKFQSHFYFETPTCLVCIISSADSAPDINQFLSDLDSARSLFPFTFFVSVGNTVDNYEDVSSSYRNAHSYLFLQYTAMRSLICSTLLLPVSTHALIEQNFSSMPLDDYLRQILSAFNPALDTRKRMAYQLTVINHGLEQTAFKKNRQPVLLELLREIPGSGKYFHEISAYLKRFITTCYQIVNELQSAQSSQYPCVDTVIDAIHEFSNKDISLKTLAAQLNMHPSYLGNIFHQQTGYYFNDYLNEERLKYAAGLMIDTPLKMKEIVDKSGFSSQAYFNRIFKRKYGTSPLAYRREMKSKNLHS